MKTKTTVLFSAVFFLLAAVTWAQTNPVSDFSYDLNAAGDGVVIKAYIGTIGSPDSPSVKVVIPGTIEGYPVTEIGVRAFYAKYGIGYDKEFEDVKHGVTEVVIPDSVTTIGSVAFSGNILAKVTLPGKLLTLGDYAFQRCEKLGAVNLPNTLTSIGVSAFNNCTALTAVTIPASVTSIGNSAFKGCGKLAALTFAAGSKLETIGIDAFAGTALSAVTIPASVTGIGSSAFADCNKLQTLTFAEGSLCTKIGNNAFTRTAITEISIPESVTEIGENAFRICESLTKVTMPAHPITYTGNQRNDAFAWCSRLTLASKKAITDTGYTGTF